MRSAKYDVDVPPDVTFLCLRSYIYCCCVGSFHISMHWIEHGVDVPIDLNFLGLGSDMMLNGCYKDFLLGDVIFSISRIKHDIKWWFFNKSIL